MAHIKTTSHVYDVRVGSSSIFLLVRSRRVTREMPPSFRCFNPGPQRVLGVLAARAASESRRASADTSIDQAGDALKAAWEIWKCWNDGPDPTRPHCGFWCYTCTSVQLSIHPVTEHERTRPPACLRSTHNPNSVTTCAPATSQYKMRFAVRRRKAAHARGSYRPSHRIGCVYWTGLGWRI